MSRGQGLGWLGDAMLCKNILSITLNYARFIPDWLIAPACIEAWRLFDQMPRRLQWVVGWSVWSLSSPCLPFSSSAVLSRSVSAKNSNNVSPPLLLYHRFAPKHTPQCVKYIFLLLYTYLFYCEMCAFFWHSALSKKNLNVKPLHGNIWKWKVIWYRFIFQLFSTTAIVVLQVLPKYFLFANFTLLFISSTIDSQTKNLTVNVF